MGRPFKGREGKEKRPRAAGRSKVWRNRSKKKYRASPRLPRLPTPASRHGPPVIHPERAHAPGACEKHAFNAAPSSPPTILPTSRRNHSGALLEQLALQQRLHPIARPSSSNTRPPPSPTHAPLDPQPATPAQLLQFPPRPRAARPRRSARLKPQRQPLLPHPLPPHPLLLKLRPDSAAGARSDCCAPRRHTTNADIASSEARATAGPRKVAVRAPTCCIDPSSPFPGQLWATHERCAKRTAGHNAAAAAATSAVAATAVAAAGGE
eukprot:356009-Chlamydomonas_euryale.AAC.4